MILLRISTQTHVINACLHLSPAGNQFLHRGSASQDIEDFFHQLLKESRDIRDFEDHDLPLEDTALRGYRGEQFLGCSGRFTCQKALRLSILAFNWHLGILFRVFCMLAILPELFWVFLLTSL